MNLVLHLSPEMAAKLNERADRLGKDPAAVALEALEDRLGVEDEARLPRDKWHAQFNDFLATIPATQAVVVDDSRERIYEGRGE